MMRHGARVGAKLRMEQIQTPCSFLAGAGMRGGVVVTGLETGFKQGADPVGVTGMGAGEAMIAGGADGAHGPQSLGSAKTQVAE